MRAPTLEGYAARHSKLSKSVTFNKYTLQSPPSEQILSNSPLDNESVSTSQEYASLPLPYKLSFRPLCSGATGALQTIQPCKDEDLGEVVTGVKDVIQARLVRSNNKLLCMLLLQL